MSQGSVPLTVPVKALPAYVQPGPHFRKEVIRVMGYILQFILVYLVMIALAVALAAACVYGGIALIIALPKFWTLMIGLGIIGLGIMVFIFLLKFLFAVSRQDRSGYIEIMESEEPELFSAIRQVARDTGTSFPKHIYLSPDVNASVFYDSSFWSMFLPVRKNLVIGLGLVNGVNKSEFLAVMAHEFGHFSQRSMKLGSFVYQVNRIIHNMLFENTGYAGFLQAWANISDYFFIFASLTVKIISGIQWVLRQMYSVVNKGYMGLSREMEFHADAVAASVCGSNNLGAALRQLELVDSSYQAVLNHCNGCLKQDEIIGNFYPGHRFVMGNGGQSQEDFSRVNFKNQWASHPPTEERIARLAALGLIGEVDTNEAWTLFKDPDSVQQRMTTFVYSKSSVDLQNKSILDAGSFVDSMAKEKKKRELPALYKGCYDYRLLSDVSLDELIGEFQTGAETPIPDQLFNSNVASLTARIFAAEQDIALLTAIAEKNIDTETFDFAGCRYSSEETADVIKILRNEIETFRSQLLLFDKTVISLALQGASVRTNGERKSLEQAYRNYFSVTAERENFFKEYEGLMTVLSPVTSGEMLGLERINEIICQVKDKYEPWLKKQLLHYQEAGWFRDDASLTEEINSFVSANYVYFHDNAYLDEELDTLLRLAAENWQRLLEHQFSTYRDMLEVQAEIVGDYTNRRP